MAGKDDTRFEEIEIGGDDEEANAFADAFEEQQKLVVSGQKADDLGDEEDDDVDYVFEDEEKPKPQAKPKDAPKDERETRRKSRAQERIQKLANERKELQARLEQLESQNIELEDRLNTQQQASARAQARILTERLKDLQAQQRIAAENQDWETHARLSQAANDAGLKLQVLAYQESNVPPSRRPQLDENGNPVQRRPQQRPPQMPEAAQDWVAENEWFAAPITQDDLIRQRAAVMIGRQLMAEQVDPETDEYYEELDRRLEKRLGKYNPTGAQKKAPIEDEEEEAAPPPRRQVQRDVPIVSGDGRQAPVRRKGRNTVRLTAEDRQIIDDLGISVQEYVAQLRAREESGNTGWTEIG